MSYTLSFASAGQIIVSGGASYTIHLSTVSTYAPSNITVSAVVYDDSVVLTEVGGGVQHKLSISQITSPVYATTQDLMDDIVAQVAAMYAGGGTTVNFNLTPQAGAVIAYREGVTASGLGMVEVWTTDDGTSGGNIIYSACKILSVHGTPIASSSPSDALVLGITRNEDDNYLRAHVFTGNPSIAALDNALTAPADGLPVRIWFIGIPL